MRREHRPEDTRQLIKVARGLAPADLVIRGARWLNVFTERFESGDIAISGGRIAGIGTYQGQAVYQAEGLMLVPGFIDGHIHLESSLLSPASFAACVLPHGTTAVICDPHEICNVLGVNGLDYMLQATEGLPLDVFVMLPSCVPASSEDESFAPITAAELAPYYSHPRVLGLAEMMDYRSLLDGQDDLLRKLDQAKAHGCPVDGHAPQLTGRELQAYIAAGILSDHECVSYEEGLEKLRLGQWLMIREGTAARNLLALLPLLQGPTASRCLLVSDDKHPGDLLATGHIDGLVRLAIQHGTAPVHALKAASWNAAQAFGLARRGAIAPGYLADLILLNQEYQVQATFKAGQPVYTGSPVAFAEPSIDANLQTAARKSFNMPAVRAQDFMRQGPLGVIRLMPGQITTGLGGLAAGIDLKQDLIKVALLERHHHAGRIGLGLLQGYGLKRGAIATSIAHDSHNLLVAGTNEEDMACAAEQVRKMQGGLAIAEKGRVTACLPLPIAGLMSDQDVSAVDASLKQLKALAADMGVPAGIEPLMSLSFLALTVVPEARLSTRGVLDVGRWRYLSN